jgi:hypothetical protein
MTIIVVILQSRVTHPRRNSPYRINGMIQPPMLATVIRTVEKLEIEIAIRQLIAYS